MAGEFIINVIILQEYLANLVVDKHEPLPKNKQTWKKSAQSLLESSWTGDLFVNSVLNQGREEDQDGKRVVPPVRWASDSSFKEGEKTIITYSFATKKSKFNYGDDRVKKIKPYANFSKGQKRIYPIYLTR